MFINVTLVNMFNSASCVGKTTEAEKLEELVKAVYPVKTAMTEIDVLHKGTLSSAFRTLLNHRYEMENAPCRDFLIASNSIHVSYPVYKEAVFKAFKEIENIEYQNPEEVETVLKRIYTAAELTSRTTSRSHKDTTMTMEKLIQFTATACHNMFGLNQLQNVPGEDVDRARGLMQWLGEKGYANLKKYASNSFKISSLGLYTEESIRAEYKAFIHCYFVGNVSSCKFNAPCAIQGYLHTIDNMASDETKAFVETCKGKILISEAALCKLDQAGLKIVRRLRYYLKIKKYMTTCFRPTVAVVVTSN